jgi:hypothetical protein
MTGRHQRALADGKADASASAKRSIARQSKSLSQFIGILLFAAHVGHPVECCRLACNVAVSHAAAPSLTGQSDEFEGIANGIRSVTERVSMPFKGFRMRARGGGIASTIGSS